MTNRIFNIPVALGRRFAASGAGLILRADSVSALLAGLPDPLPKRLVSLQAGVRDFDHRPLLSFPVPVPFDLVLDDPDSWFDDLYRLVEALPSRPVRASVVVRPGFGQAVKLAGALGLPVRLLPGQPDAELAGELLGVLDVYLHRPLQCQPVEFFHSVLAAFFRGENASLWAISEDDPALIGRVGEDGREMPPSRCKGASAVSGPPWETFVDRLGQDLRARGGECLSCPFGPVCRGYFKFPDPGYSCEGVRAVFSTLREAAGELRRDVAANLSAEEGVAP